MSDLELLISKLIHSAHLDPERTRLQLLPAKKPDYDESSGVLDSNMRILLEEAGITRLYTHQALTLEAFRDGKNILLSTPTASGKSLCYQIPTVQMIRDEQTSCALYLFPFKALAQDQAKNLSQLLGRLPLLSSRPLVRIHDGDTPQDQRKKTMSNPPSVLITNPDILHYSILPNHTKWHVFLKNLRLIVIDEIHVYRGTFGSHVLQVFQRLNRILDLYQSHPQTIACSATIGNPLELTQNLTGKPFHLIQQSGAPQRTKAFVSVLPSGQTSTEASHLFESCITSGLKTIVFTKSRRSTELIYRIFRDRNANLSDRVSVYRAGFLPEERRTIEQRLFENKLDGVISTSALELGIDVGGLDCCILVGFPGSLASMWQRAGRVGRGSRPSIVFFIAGEDALDRYWFFHESRLLEAPVEKAVVYKDNDYITDSHLQCAADELPIMPGINLPVDDHVSSRIDQLCRQGNLLQSMDGSMYVCREPKPHRSVSIRSIGESYRIMDEDRTPIGNIDGIRVFKECHEGAIYLHGGRVYRVAHLDMENFIVTVEAGPEEVYTQTYAEKQTDILSIDGETQLHYAKIKWGRLRVHEKITGYSLKRILSQEIITKHPLELPEIVFETRGIWFEFDPALIEAVQAENLHPMGGLHGLEHAVIGHYPLIAICDRSDLAGISTRHHVQTGSASVFIYDGFPGGLGLAESALEHLTVLLETTDTTISHCSCEMGCPCCIHSPKCGAGNEPLDKQATLMLLEGLCGKLEVAMKSEVPAQSELDFSAKETTNPGNQGYPENSTLVFDLETQLSAEEVGGWRNSDKMLMALSVIYDIELDRYETYFEKDVQNLITRLNKAKLVIGFNTERFDFKVLSGYMGGRMPVIRSLDILKHIEQQLGHRLSLNQIAAATLDIQKSADGLQSLVWWKEGKVDLIEKYCRKDVEITHAIYRFGLDNGYIAYPHHSGLKARIPVSWRID